MHWKKENRLFVLNATESIASIEFVGESITFRDLLVVSKLLFDSSTASSTDTSLLVASNPLFNSTARLSTDTL